MSGRVWATAILVGIGTYLLRVVFLAGDRADAMPPMPQRALRYIPPAALAALAVPPLLRPDGALPNPIHPVTLAGLVAGLVAFRTRSVPWTMVAGLVAAIAFDAFLPGSIRATPG